MSDIELLSVHNHLENAVAWDAFGRNSAVGGTFEHIWSQGGVHTELSAAAGLKVSSSSDSDTFDVKIVGLDADWNLQTVTQTLAGKTKTAVGTGETWIRVWEMSNVGTGAAVGDVYCYLDDTVVAGVPQTQTKIQLKMQIGYERSMAARLSVPDNKVASLISWGGYISAAAASEINLMYRPFGEVAEVHRVMSCYFNGEMINYVKPLQFPAKSDIFLRAKGNGAISGELNGFYHDV